ncbi:M48 family metalloprotease [Jannaschia sp. Os4]|uniref:M48 family metalloprotease n=1 Tax=Jannaschia sp. Os4 TaxID=2807617 RepID=UPI00193A83AA|nr:M48 family metalloprotease [Jannaschia sp. Os4]MBM2576898.1 M48 family metalloprotease [Jannaschia sp. Os4]
MIRVLLVLLVAASPSWARGPSVIRDAEIEHALRQVAAPILQAAGLPASTGIIVIDDDSLNAFVVDNRTIFIHSGLILRLSDHEELMAVIAHEAAHIANGHLTRRPANARAARTAAALGTVLGAAAAAAGSSQAGLGIAAGSASAAERNFLAHTRAEEASADQSSLRYLASAGVDPAAAKRVLDIFVGQEVLSVGRQDPYARSHPLSRDRLRAVEGFAAAITPRDRDTRAVRYWYARAVGKLSAFLRAPRWTLRRATGSDEVSALRRAIATHRRGRTRDAVATMDRLIAARGSDAYFHELRGQMLLEGGHAAAAVASYRRAADLAPREALIRAGLGRALLAAGDPAGALRVLEPARASDPFDPAMLRDLSQAHAAVGQTGLAAVAGAERYAVLGQRESAARLAERASGLLPRGSSGWLRAQDVLGATR